MRYGRALLAGLGWVGTLGGLALCVLILLSASVAFDDHGDRAGPRDGEVIRLPSDSELPRVSLGRAPAGASPPRITASPAPSGG